MRRFCLLAAALISFGCDRPAADAERRAAGSAAAVAPTPDACRSGGGTIQQAPERDWLPRRVGGLCIDPHAHVRSYGGGAKAPLAAGCEHLGGECDGYARFGLARFVVLPYVVGTEPRARIGVTLLELGSPEAAYALFTQRVAPEPGEGSRPWRFLDGRWVSALRGTSAIVVRASRLALLEYSDETRPPQRAAEAAGQPLEALAGALENTLPGEPGRPAAAALLPERDGGPQGMRFEHDDVFGIAGLGSGAMAHYDAPGGRREIAVLVRADDDAAKDVLRTLRRITGARSLKGTAYETVRVSLREAEGAPRVEWFFARKRKVVVGIGRRPEKLDRHSEAMVRHREVARLNELLGDV